METVRVQQPWILAAGVLVAANLLVLVALHGRRLRQKVRLRRTRRFEEKLAVLLEQLDEPRDPTWLRRQIESFNELERPIAAVRLIERLRLASPEERERTLQTLREVGAVDRLLRATRARMPWRRALAIRTLGWAAAAEAVPVLLERVQDRHGPVREAAVRALGRIGDERALSTVAELFVEPGPVAPGVAYDALVSFGAAAAPVFAGALGSELESVRVGSCYGLAAVGAADDARALLEPLLDDASGRVRAAAAESLGLVGGGALPAGLTRAAYDEEATVRSAAVAALAAFDDPRSVDVAVSALRDRDRDTVIRAAESLVRLGRRPAAGAHARAALDDAQDEWPVERAAILASLGAV